MNYSCPCCDEEIEVPAMAQEIQCPHCFRRLIVDADAEFENGTWHDLTTLTAQKEFYDQL